ncbi:hypothetical protein ACEPAI_1467 [Sanghuangporus weigelae]
MPISYLAVVGTPNAFGKVFHFRLYLVSRLPGAREASILIDMRPFLTGSRSMDGIAVVKYVPYAYSRNIGTMPFLVPATPGISAGTFLEIIFTRYSLNQYIFTDSVQGCRHWCASVLERLAQERLVPVGIPQEFADYEVEEHRRFGSKFPLPRITGTFYQ